MKPRLRFGAKVIDIFIWAVIFIVLYGEDDGNSVYLRSLLTPMPLKPAGEGGHIHKGVYWTLWFWLFENFATSNCSSKTKQRWMPLGCIIYYLDRFDAKERRWSVKGRLYIHIGVGLSRCSFRRTGQCEGLQTVERVTGLAPRFVCIEVSNLLWTIAKAAKRGNEFNYGHERCFVSIVVFFYSIFVW